MPGRLSPSLRSAPLNGSGPDRFSLDDVDVAGLGEFGQVAPVDGVVLADGLPQVIPLEAGLALEALVPLLGGDLDHAADRLAVLGVEAAGEHLDLIDDRGVDLVAVAAAGQRVVHVHPVDHEHGVVRAAAPDVDGVVLQGHARLLGDHVHHLVQRHGLHLAAVQEVGAAGAVDLDQGALGRDLEGLDQDGLHLEPEVEVQDLARSQGDGVLAQGVTDVRGPDCVGPRPQPLDDVEAVGEGHGADVGAGDEDVGVGHRFAALVVEDPALDGGRARGRLGGHRGLGQRAHGRTGGQTGQDQNREQAHPHCPTPSSSVSRAPRAAAASAGTNCSRLTLTLTTSANGAVDFRGRRTAITGS